MKERAAELKRAGGKGAAKKAEEAQACLDKIAEMPDSDRVLAERIHAIVTQTAPDLDAKTWYGMPAYARDGKVVVLLQAGREVQGALRHARLRGRREPRRRRHVAHVVRRHAADEGRREADRGPGQARDELRCRIG